MTGTETAGRSPTPLDRLRTADPMLLLLRATTVALVVINNGDIWVFGPLAVMSVVVLPWHKALQSPWLWAALFVAVGLRQLATWHTIDDHAVVMTYWCGAIALGLSARDPSRTLAAAARFLIGALFALAAGWKLFSGQFLDGTFFRYELLLDDRFEFVADVVGGTTSTMRDANLDAVNALRSGNGDGSVALVEGPRNELVANAFTWWGAAIEATVAVVFLAPLRRRWGWLRHAALIAFAATTYLVVPIGGFGTLLLVLGAAMATTERGRTAYYVGGAGLLLWAGLWPLVFL